MGVLYSYKQWPRLATYERIFPIVEVRVTYQTDSPLRLEDHDLPIGPESLPFLKRVILPRTVPLNALNGKKGLVIHGEMELHSNHLAKWSPNIQQKWPSAVVKWEG
ncbi:MAG TPA: hypothetical protein VKE40_24080 [Gemmataceae bacterium]|nr:hypothetical protein [Gemmataceae bacterium]